MFFHFDNAKLRIFFESTKYFDKKNLPIFTDKENVNKFIMLAT